MDHDGQGAGEVSKVLVVGSINMDLVVNTRRFPRPGETLGDAVFSTHFGGKGANQAVAARRLGAEVALLGCVGDDVFGQALLSGLRAEGVDVSSVRCALQQPSGVAAITVCAAENAIVVAPGANHALTPADIEAAAAAFECADIVLSQLEIPLPTVLAAASMAARLGKPFLLNPAPAAALPAELLALTTLLTPNTHEIEALFPVAAGGGWRALLAAQGPRLLMTDGAAGVWFADAEGALHHQPAFAVDAVDSTGAGDTFNGALAAFWSLPRAEAIYRASAAAALSVTRPGAQGGMPTEEELAHYLARERSH